MLKINMTRYKINETRHSKSFATNIYFSYQKILSRILQMVPESDSQRFLRMNLLQFLEIKTHCSLRKLKSLRVIYQINSN